MAKITFFSTLINRNSSTRDEARNPQWCTNKPIHILTTCQQSILKSISKAQPKKLYNFAHSVADRY